MYCLEHARFEELVLPHLDAGYNLARWLTRDVNDAEDVVQDACMRALKYVGIASRRRCPGVVPDHRAPRFLRLVRAQPAGGDCRRMTALRSIWPPTIRP